MGKRKNRGAPGQTLVEQQMFDRMVHAIGIGWLEMVNAVDGLLDEGIVVTRLSMKGDWRVPGDPLVIITAEAEGRAVVCFHRVDNIQDVWKSLAQRLSGGGIEWREDLYVPKE